MRWIAAPPPVGPPRTNASSGAGLRKSASKQPTRRRERNKGVQPKQEGDKSASFLAFDRDWKQHLDRLRQTAIAKHHVGEMVDRPQIRCQCLCWSANQQDGTDLFHQRLETEFEKMIKNRCRVVRAEWPVVRDRRAFCEMLCSLLGVGDLREVGRAIREKFSSRGQQYLFVNHMPIRESLQITSHEFVDYLDWWDKAVLPHLQRQQQVIIASSFVRDEPSDLKTEIKNEVAELGEKFQRLKCDVLDPLHPLDVDQLEDFFEYFFVSQLLNPKHQQEAIEEIMASTQGEYDRVIKLLEVLFVRGIDELRKIIALHRQQ